MVWPASPPATPTSVPLGSHLMGAAPAPARGTSVQNRVKDLPGGRTVEGNAVEGLSDLQVTARCSHCKAEIKLFSLSKLSWCWRMWLRPVITMNSQTPQENSQPPHIGSWTVKFTAWRWRGECGLTESSEFARRRKKGWDLNFSSLVSFTALTAEKNHSSSERRVIREKQTGSQTSAAPYEEKK